MIKNGGCNAGMLVLMMCNKLLRAVGAHAATDPELPLHQALLLLTHKANLRGLWFARDGIQQVGLVAHIATVKQKGQVTLRDVVPHF